jgi:3-oxoacyl-[acyl-carrier-protein] synthase III
MMKGQKVNNAMVITAEIENNKTRLPDQLMGLEETGSALILDESPDGKTGFGNFHFKAFTDYIESVDTVADLMHAKNTLCIEKDPHLEEYYLHCIQETVGELLCSGHLEMEQIKVILPPQISSAFIDELGHTLHVDCDKLVDVQAQHDLFTSSLPYTLQQVYAQGLVEPGDVGLIISVGSGIQVCCATYYF